MAKTEDDGSASQLITESPSKELEAIKQLQVDLPTLFSFCRLGGYAVLSDKLVEPGPR